MRLILHPRHLLLLSVPPYRVEILEELVHECLRDAGGTAVPEVVRDLEGLFGDPVVALPLEVLQCQSALRRTRVTLAQLLRVVDVGAWVHIADVVLLGV